MFFQRHYNYNTIIIQGVKPVVGTELLAPAKLIFNTPVYIGTCANITPTKNSHTKLHQLNFRPQISGKIYEYLCSKMFYYYYYGMLPYYVHEYPTVYTYMYRYITHTYTVYITHTTYTYNVK